MRALLLTESGGKVSSRITEVDEAGLPPGDVTVRISHSTVNYKDGMILNGLGRLVRQYPHVPGIDFAGTVEASSSPDFKPGEQVVVTGNRVGETRWGGYAAMARVPAGFVVKLPDALSPAQSMALGTAGFTAMIALMELEDHGLKPEAGEVLVTGAGGGVGGVAVALLAARGYTVVASSGRPQLADHLRALGAATVIGRDELAKKPDRPLLSERWAGCIDAVGGLTLATVLAGLKYGQAVAACGLAGGNDLPTTVIPFLLRGVKLLGIDSVAYPMARRRIAWQRLAREIPKPALDRLTEVAPLDRVPELGQKILKGEVRGRVVIDVNQ